MAFGSRRSGPLQAVVGMAMATDLEYRARRLLAASPMDLLHHRGSTPVASARSARSLLANARMGLGEPASPRSVHPLGERPRRQRLRLLAALARLGTPSRRRAALLVRRRDATPATRD